MNYFLKIKKVTAVILSIWIVIGMSGTVGSIPIVHAETEMESQEALDAEGNPTGAPECTGASCDYGKDQGDDQGTGQGSDQGTSQGTDQGKTQGGPTLEDLGATEDEEGNTVLPEGTVDTRQGASQGSSQGTSDTNAQNTNTGAGSENTIESDTQNSSKTNTQNASSDTTRLDADSVTGGNTTTKNSGDTAISTGNANVGVTQVKNNNTTTSNGDATLDVRGHDGSYDGDLEIAYDNIIAHLTGGNENTSVRAINEGTGSDSSNEVYIATKLEELFGVQNDGEINNSVDIAAISGDNESSKNTGDGKITTGNANAAATLVNLLNNTIINGSLLLSIYDIFGDLTGDVILPNLQKIASMLTGNKTSVDVQNEDTGSDSTNTIDVDVKQKESTTIANDADIETVVNADAVTGENEATANTGGGNVKTGDGSASASNITLANTTVSDGNWGIVIINALNRWTGFLYGDSGEVRELSQEETLRHIEAQNTNTGSDSENTITIEDETVQETEVDNKAKISNEINASAISGRNTSTKNTGKGEIETGDANVLASAINIANTTIKNAVLGISVVNVFGNWIGDLLFEGNSLFGAAQGGVDADIEAGNSTTGADSSNTVSVDIEDEKNTNIDNKAKVNTVLNANVNTGGNSANKNTLGGAIETGDAFMALHTRTIANSVGIAADGSLNVSVKALNGQTGTNSQNIISATINQEQTITVKNDADVSTVISADANTGNNEASYNTTGGSIVTGLADANVAVRNFINRLFILGSGSGPFLNIDVEARNHNTGYGSENSNTVSALRNLLLNLYDKAVVDTFIDVFLNSGNNVASNNTGGGYIATSIVCLDGEVVNIANTSEGSLPAGATIESINIAEVNNDVSIVGNTGENSMERNTGGIVEGVDGKDVCPQPEEDPSDDTTPSDEETPEVPVEEPGREIEDEHDLVVGTIIDEEPIVPIISGVVAAAEEVREQVSDVPGLAAAGTFLGGLQLPNYVIWPVFGFLSAGMLAGAVHNDRQRKITA